MKISKKELKVVYISVRILESILPFEDEVEEVLDMCRTLLEPSEIMEFEQEALEIMSGSSILKPLAESF